MHFLFVCLLFILFAQVFGEVVVGVLTFPVDEEKGTESYIKESYIEYLMSGGARVVPILYNETSTGVEELFGSLNGVLFTGGPKAPLDFPVYFQTATLLYQLSLQSYIAGNPVPLWGTCLGFETIATIQDLANGHDGNVLTSFDAEKISLPLEFTSQGYASKLFRNAPRNVLQALRSSDITVNWHSYGVSPSYFNARLTPQLSALTTNQDRDGLTFVSTLEHSEAYIFATQFHPEANSWDDDDMSVISRSKEAIVAADYFADTFVNFCRMNDHMMASNELKKARIDLNYPLKDLYYWFK